MINITDRVVVLPGASPHCAVRDAIAHAIALLEQHVGRPCNPCDAEHFGLATLLGRHNLRRDRRFDTDFIEASLRLAISNSHSGSGTASLDALATYVVKRNVPVTGIDSLKRGLKLMLVELWRQRRLLLPTTFTPRANFPVYLFTHELLDWLKAFEPKKMITGGGKVEAHRLSNWGARLIWTTDWQRVEDVSLAEIADLHRAFVAFKYGRSDNVICGANMPWSVLPARLLQHFPDRATFNREDLDRYSSWAHCGAMEGTSFKDFQGQLRRKPESRRASATAATEEGTRAGAKWLENGVLTATTHEGMLQAFKRLGLARSKTMDWSTQTPTYAGREHVDISTSATLWIMTFKAFLYHRAHIQGYRTDGGVISSLNVLADYLFFYLPWWTELHPQSRVDVPQSPKAFRRYPFVTRQTDGALDELPKPLLEMVALRRRSNDTAYIVIRHLALYFKFVQTSFADNDRIAGPTFTVPINETFDSPRLKKRSKTTKEVIPKSIYGFMLFYCYAIETFGQHLLSLALSGKLNRSIAKLNHCSRFVCEQFGLIPDVRYRGKSFPLKTVPNVFVWVERSVVEGNTSRRVLVPHLSSHRLQTAALETGLRFQSLQWLDRNTFDSRNTNAGVALVYDLLVNTDKTRTEPWVTPVMSRVRELLLREHQFQGLFVDVRNDKPVAYEGLESSPFPPIHPLFRAAGTSQPVNDASYVRTWTQMMVDFEHFYRDATGEQHVRLFRLRPVLEADGTARIAFRRGASPYCPISVLTVHTPHSCRATFATNRQGPCDLSDVAELLGHKNLVTSASYTKFSAEDLRMRLRESDDAILADFSLFDPDSNFYVRADKPDSALVRSFTRDREKAIKDFRFMPPMALWSTQEAGRANEDALELLRNGPMSRIRFRETHICPVGEECPIEVVQQIGAFRRCGGCPLAMKCTDHLPAITAKRNQLLERIRYVYQQRMALERAGEPATSIDALWDEMELDVNEFLGWQLSEEVLSQLHSQSLQEGTEIEHLHADCPDMIRHHLQRVVGESSKTQFILQRIAESNAYPTMTSPQVQAVAAHIKRKLLAGRGIEDLVSWASDAEDVKAVSKLLNTLMQVHDLDLADIARQLDAPDNVACMPLLLSDSK